MLIVELEGWTTVVSWNRLPKKVARSVDLQLCRSISFSAFMCIISTAVVLRFRMCAIRRTVRAKDVKIENTKKTRTRTRPPPRSPPRSHIPSQHPNALCHAEWKAHGHTHTYYPCLHTNKSLTPGGQRRARRRTSIRCKQDELKAQGEVQLFCAHLDLEA